MAEKNNIENQIENASQKVVEKLHGDKVIWMITFILTLFSLAVVYSSSSSLAYKHQTSNFSFVVNQLIFVALGWVVLFICYKIPIKWYRLLSFSALVLTIGLLALTLVLNHNLNGAARGLSLGGITFQPSELAKITIVLYLARIIEISPLETFGEFAVKILAPVLVLCGLIAWGSISMALLVGIIVFVIFIATGIKWNYIWKSALIVGGLGLCVVLTHVVSGGKAFPRLSTAVGRIERFTKGEEKDLDTKELTKEELQARADEDLQEDMARIAIVSGKLFGKGPGKSTQRFILPHPYSDFVYSLIVEEYGMIVAIIIMWFYMVLLYSCIKLAKQCKAVFSSVVVTGLGFGITFQAFLHILVNVGIMPITGHTLPLISLGGSSLIMIMGSIGIILSVSRTREAVDTQQKEEKAAEAKINKEENNFLGDEESNINDYEQFQSNN